MEIWVEKYRPKTLDEIVGQDEIVNKLKKYKSIEECPHFIFAGPPGVGKTATAWAFGRHLGLNDSQIVEFNASDDRGIQFIRGKLKELAFTVGEKLIILDEADNLTKDAQEALRRTMEKVLKKTKVRFILTCNYPNRIIDPLLSRCSVQYFKPLNKESQFEILKRIAKEEGILRKIGLEDFKKAIAYILIASKGDMRKAINMLQEICVAGQVSEETIKRYVEGVNLADEIINLVLKGDIEEAKNKLELLYIRNGYDPFLLLEKLYQSSKKIDDPLLRAQFLRSLRMTDIGLNMGKCNPLIQLITPLMDLWVALYVIPKKKE